MKKFCFVIITIILFLCTGCRTKFRFQHNTSEIETIEIIQIESIIPPSFEILSIVDSKEGFLKEFSLIDCYTKTPPSGINIGEIAIRIMYNNGDYDLIAKSGQSRYANGDYDWYDGHWSFVEIEFDALIKKYTQSNNVE